MAIAHFTPMKLKHLFVELVELISNKLWLGVGGGRNCLLYSSFMASFQAYIQCVAWKNKIKNEVPSNVSTSLESSTYPR